jgi:anti-anti-sigma factor
VGNDDEGGRSYEIRVRSRRGRLLVNVSGEVDVLAWRDLEAMTDTVVVTDMDLDLDLEGLTFVDAHGLGALRVVVERLAERGRSVRLLNLPPNVRRIVRLVAPDLEELIVEQPESREEDG